MERQDEDIGQSKKRKVSEKRSREGTTRLREQNEALKQEVDRLKGEVEQVNERWMRAAAELENFKKRSAREREDWTKYANENLLKQLLPVLDSLQRALDHKDNQDNAEVLLEGIEMIHRQFVSTLENMGVEPIEALNQPFDPAKHEAIMQVESEDHEPNTVVQEMEQGYFLHNRLLRPARVVVSKEVES